VAGIGPGMVGVAGANYLPRDGHNVVVIDAVPPGQGASFAHSGCFNPSTTVLWPFAQGGTVFGRSVGDRVAFFVDAYSSVDPLHPRRHVRIALPFD
jgi:NADPH-dependent 2,4-dienoyl-CoA reductase/sulfur reductase-like enzyme